MLETGRVDVQGLFFDRVLELFDHRIAQHFLRHALDLRLGCGLIQSSIQSDLKVFNFSFFFNYPATTEIYTLSLHDALPISADHNLPLMVWYAAEPLTAKDFRRRSEEHTSELQSPCNLVCRLLLEKKKK